jgi:hypothetical protein
VADTRYRRGVLRSSPDAPTASPVACCLLRNDHLGDLEWLARAILARLQRASSATKEE